MLLPCRPCHGVSCCPRQRGGGAAAGRGPCPSVPRHPLPVCAAPGSGLGGDGAPHAGENCLLCWGSPNQPGVPLPAWPHGGVLGNEAGATSLCFVAFFSTRKHMAPSSWRWLLPGHLLVGMGRLLLAPLSSGLACALGSSIAPHAGETLVHHGAAALPAQGLATLQPAHGRARLGPRGCPGWGHLAQPAIALSSLPQLGGHGHVGHRGRSQMQETGANHASDGELLVPITVAGGTWEVCPRSPQLPLPRDLPEGGHRSPGHILTPLAVGMKPGR